MHLVELKPPTIPVDRPLGPIFSKIDFEDAFIRVERAAAASAVEQPKVAMAAVDYAYRFLAADMEKELVATTGVPDNKLGMRTKPRDYRWLPIVTKERDVIDDVYFQKR